VIKKIENFIKSYQTKRHLKRFYDENYSAVPNGKKVLIYAGIGHMYMSYFEVLIYHLLKKEGCEVDYLVYDEHIPINEVITKKVLETKDKNDYWKNNVKNSINLLNTSKVEFEFINTSRKEIENELSDLPKTLESIFSYVKDGINFGEIVKGTMYRFYKSLTFGNDALEVAQQFLFTTLTNYYEIKERNSNKDYDLILFSHGIYVTWEPVVEFCKQQKIDFVCYDRAKTKNTINVNFNQVAPDWSFNTAWQRYTKKALTIHEKEMVRNYLKERELQANDVFAYNFSERSENLTLLKNQLKIPLDSKVITIFTNLIWDAANVSRDLAFKNALECVIETIEFFKNHPKVHVVLRAHPAEKVLGTKERYGDLVRMHFKDGLPDYVTIIEPEMEVNSFSVIDISDIGVVNTSTVGLEFALLGKPILLISDTHYRNKGFTYDVSSKEEYFKELNILLKTGELKPNQISLSEKYFYMMMFKYQQNIPLEYEKGVFRKYTYKTINSIPPNHNIYKIVNKMLDNERNDFIYWN